MNENKQTNNENEFFFKSHNAIYKINHFTVNGKREQFGLGDKAVYCYLLHWQINGKEKRAYPSIVRITDDLGITKPTLKKHIDRLQRIGLVKVEGEKGKRNSYTCIAVDEVLALSVNAAAASQWNGTRHEIQPGDATPNLKQQPQESPAETTDKRQHQQVKDPAEVIASHDDFDALLCRPSAKHSPAALLEGLLGGDAATPASITPTASAVEDDWNREPF
ncbi:helix-turn-helix domain-containing protein [Serratia odorifera]|uniref:helix-turn-helix domain-containing protein n=1 Tax=Serratia odorifera TaxID=618 RepID=UPI0023607CBF|nr:helix-turn-helix domain-containing protein [Serratia odorifera]